MMDMTTPAGGPDNSAGRLSTVAGEGVAVSADDWLDVAGCAELWGIAPSTWRSLVRSGLAPAPDDPDDDRPANRRRPRWRRVTVTSYNRIGRGRWVRRRTDPAD